MAFLTAHTACRVCGGPDLASVLDLGVHALAGQFPLPDEPDPPRAPLHVVRCTACGLVQLEHSVDPAEMFNDGYGYRSSVTATMTAHLTRVAREAGAMLAARQGPVCVAPRVLSVGENDGTLLNAVDLPTAVRVAVDPCGVETDGRYPGIRRIKGFFPRDVLLTQKYDLIFMVACFYDATDPVAWADAVRRLLAPGGLWCVEVADKSAVLRKVAFDYWVSEHETLLSAHDIAEIGRRAGLRLVRVEESDSNGGSLRCYLAHADCRGYDGDPDWVARRDALVAHGRALAQDGDACDRFAAQARKLAADLGAAVEDAVAAGRPVYLLGASTKAGTVLQFAGLGRKLVALAADRDPRKAGRRMPGTGIPVVAEDLARAAVPSDARGGDPLWVTTLPFRDEILARERAAGARGEVLFFPSLDRVAL